VFEQQRMKSRANRAIRTWPQAPYPGRVSGMKASGKITSRAPPLPLRQPPPPLCAALIRFKYAGAFCTSRVSSGSRFLRRPGGISGREPESPSKLVFYLLF